MVVDSAMLFHLRDGRIRSQHNYDSVAWPEPAQGG
jgi:hypothetical protein